MKVNTKLNPKKCCIDLDLDIKIINRRCFTQLL